MCVALRNETEREIERELETESQRETFPWNSLDQECAHILILHFSYGVFHLSVVCGLGPVACLLHMCDRICPCLLLFGVCIYWIAQKTWYEQVIGRRGAFLQNLLTEILRGGGDFTTQNIMQHYDQMLWIYSRTLCFWQPSDSCYFRSFSTCWLFSADDYHGIYTHIILGQRHGRVQKTRTMHLP